MSILGAWAVGIVVLFISGVVLDLDRRVRRETWSGPKETDEALERIMDFGKQDDLLTGAIQKVRQRNGNR